MQKRIAIVLALIAAVLVALLAWLPSAPDSNRTEVIASSETEQAAPPRVEELAIAESPSETPSLGEQRSVAAQAALAELPEDEELADLASASEGFDATLIVRCVAKGTNQPLPGIRVSVMKKDDARGSTWVSARKAHLGETPVTDADGEVEIDLPSGADFRLYTNAEKHDASDARQEIVALAGHERRMLVLELTVGDDIRFHGLVRARDGDVPVAGAKVSLLRAEEWVPVEGEGLAPKDETLAEITTGSDGRFELAAASWKRSFLRVGAAGFGPQLIALSAIHASEDRAQVITLELSAAIEATVLDARGAPIEKAEVVASTEGRNLREKTGTFDIDSASSSRVRWTAATGVDGRCTLKDLAPRAPLTLLVKQEGKVVHKLGSTLTLESGEVRPMQVQIGAGCRVSGVLVDEKGNAIAGCVIWRLRATYPLAHYLQSYESNRLDGKATTDGTGQFAFDDVAPGQWWIGPAPPEGARGSARDDAVAPLAELVDVQPGAREARIVIKTQRGLFIRGRVLDSKGAAALRAWVSARSESVFVSATTNEDGVFTLGPTIDASFSLIAQSAGTDAGAPSDPVTARAGDKDVILRLRAGGGIEGKVADAATGEGCAAEVTCSPANQGKLGGMHITSAQPDGTFQWLALAPGSYDLTARVNDGRTGKLKGVVVNVGERTREIVLALEPGAKLRLRYDGALQPAWYEVHSDGVRVASEGLTKGKATLQVVPKGKLTITLHHKTDAETRTREIELAAGEDKEIVLADDP